MQWLSSRWNLIINKQLESDNSKINNNGLVITNMKLLTTALLLTLSSILVSASTSSENDAQNFHNCNKHNRDIATAIQAFCWNEKLMVPSTYAKNGMAWGKVLVSIDGKCKTPAWVPSSYCMTQFHSICGEVGPGTTGYGRQDFGHKGCQHFLIEKLDHPVKHVKNPDEIPAGTNKGE